MKTISVYDAVNLATKGPLKVLPSPANASFALCGDGVGTVAAATCRSECAMNATLLAHFFNHGPALLAMLEEFVKLQEPFRKQLDANETEILDESIALIAKASKVEIEE